MSYTNKVLIGYMVVWIPIMTIMTWLSTLGSAGEAIATGFDNALIVIAVRCLGGR